MSNKYFITMAIAMSLAVTTGVVNAYPAEAMFGGGYSGVRQIENQAQYTDAVNSYNDKIEDAVKEEKADKAETGKTYTTKEKNISNVVGNPKAHPTDKDYDYNPYIESSSGVNGTKTIYTDHLGRLHFFGKENKVK